MAAMQERRAVGGDEDRHDDHERSAIEIGDEQHHPPVEPVGDDPRRHRQDHVRQQADRLRRRPTSAASPDSR